MFFAALASANVAVTGRDAAECRLAFAAPDIKDTARRASLRGEICLTAIAGSIIRGSVGRTRLRRGGNWRRLHAANHQASLSQGPRYLVSLKRIDEIARSIAGGISAFPSQRRMRGASRHCRRVVAQAIEHAGGRGAVAKFGAFSDGW